jgi:hypothetical protein
VITNRCVENIEEALMERCDTFNKATLTLGNNPAKLDSWLAGLRLEVFNPASQTVDKSRIKPASRKQKA